jgi:3-hydroxyacyl-[acyl-carrier-protein] dehydratase
MTTAQLADITVTVDVDPDNPVFAGHYPGFPILPGLFLVEYVNTAFREDRAARGESPVRPIALEKVRFLQPVYPGDQVRLELSVEQSGEFTRCLAWASVNDERVAEIRLRYPAVSS